MNTQDEAGSGHVAVLSVARWEDVREKLRPNFGITAAKALEEVGKPGAVMEDHLLDMLKVVASVSTPSTSTSEQKVTTKIAESGKDPTETSTTTTTESTAPGSEITPTTSLPGTKTLPAPSITTGEPPALDAMIRYNLAAALFQEVQLLDRYIMDAAIREGYSPFVVRLQITLMPRARLEPYDAYSTISFFPRTGQPIGPPEFDARVPALLAGGSDPCRPFCPPCKRVDARVPIVIPLLVTDDMETLAAAHSANTARQYALALGALIQGFSVRADVDRYVEELVATAGRDANSLYTVSRLTDNTLRVRMGALLHSTGDVYMVPQNRNATLLLLVPSSFAPCSQVAVVARTEFVDVASGRTLPERSEQQLDQMLDSVFRNSRTLDHITDAQTRRTLLDKVTSNDYPEFARMLGDGVGEGRAQQAWVTLSSVHVGGQYASTAFTLPDLPMPTFPPQPCCGGILGVDNGQTLVATVYGDGYADGHSPITARLEIEVDSSSGKPDWTVPADSVEAKPDRLVVTFPSLRLVSAKQGSLFDFAFNSASNKLCVTIGPSSMRYAVEVLSRASAAAAPVIKPLAGITLTTASQVRPADVTGDAPLRLRVKLDQPASASTKVTVKFTFESSAGFVDTLAPLGGTSPTKVAFNQFDVAFAASEVQKDFELQLKGLSDTGSIRITGQVEGKTAVAETVVAIKK